MDEFPLKLSYFYTSFAYSYGCHEEKDEIDYRGPY